MDILAFSIISNQITKEISSKCDLNTSQTRILLFFDKNNNSSLTMGKLAELLNISLSTLSRQLQQTKTQNFVQINRSERDSSKSVRLSDEGLKEVAELKNTLSQIEKNLFSFLSPKETSAFTKQLSAVMKNMIK